MKKIVTFKSLKNLILIILVCLLQTSVWAQDNGSSGSAVNVNITKSNGNWYAQPWVWIVGGAVFILLLVALLRSNNNKG